MRCLAALVGGRRRRLDFSCRAILAWPRKVTSTPRRALEERACSLIRADARRRYFVCSNPIQKHRRHAARRQGYLCWYCGFPMWVPERGAPFPKRGAGTLAQFRCTVEHLQPRSEAGPDSAENIVAACAWCNHARHGRKQAIGPESFRTHVAKRVSQGRWHPCSAHEAFLSYSAGLNPRP